MARSAVPNHLYGVQRYNTSGKADRLQMHATEFERERAARRADEKRQKLAKREEKLEEKHRKQRARRRRRRRRGREAGGTLRKTKSCANKASFAAMGGEGRGGRAGGEIRAGAARVGGVEGGGEEAPSLPIGGRRPTGRARPRRRRRRGWRETRCTRCCRRRRWRRRRRRCTRRGPGRSSSKRARSSHGPTLGEAARRRAAASPRSSPRPRRWRPLPSRRPRRRGLRARACADDGDGDAKSWAPNANELRDALKSKRTDAHEKQRLRQKLAAAEQRQAAIVVAFTQSAALKQAALFDREVETLLMRHGALSPSQRRARRGRACRKALQGQQVEEGAAEAGRAHGGGTAAGGDGVGDRRGEA